MLIFGNSSEFLSGGILAARFAFVGLSWWGLGPEDMALSLSHFGASCDAISLWNIRRRSDRIVMNSRWAPLVANRRLSAIRESQAYEAVFVMSPHRLNADMLRNLKSRCGELIAVLGDEPIGARSVDDECWGEFDAILAADENWLRGVPPSTAKIKVMPWGSTLVDSDLINASPYRPESIILVGSPYPERVAVAQHLVHRAPVTLQGDGWPNIPGVAIRPPSSRIDTLKAIRENRELVVNIHHKQFLRGLNPQFFDYAAAGIPQLVVHADDLFRFRVGIGEDSIEGSLRDDELLYNQSIRDQNLKLIAEVRESYMFYSCVERFFNGN